MYRPFVNRDFWSDLNSCWRRNKGDHPEFTAFQAAAFKRGLELSSSGKVDIGAELSLRGQYVKPKSKSLTLNADNGQKKKVEGYAKASSAPVDEVAAMLAKIGMEDYA